MLSNIDLKAMTARSSSYKRSDSGGLFILVRPDGQKFWRLAYRYDGKQKLLSGGAYPVVGLHAARAWRDAARTQLASGQDPSDIRRAERQSSLSNASNTFEDAQSAWLSIRRPAWAPRYAALVVGRLDTDILPYLGAIPVDEITPAMVLSTLRRIEQRGAIEMAHRVKNHVSEIFRYAIADGRCASDPCRDLKAAMAKPKVGQHFAKVGAAELPAFFGRLNADQGERLSHLALRWTMLTMVRSQETRFAEWSEFEGVDGLEPLWRIPPHRMKMRSEHLVPLSRQAIALLKELHRLNVFRKAGDMRLGRFVFPVPSAKTFVISENRMLDIMYRIGLRGKATVHGFRSLASTVLNESGLFYGDWIEYQLAHQPGAIRGAYNAARYLQHRRPMMQWWADYLERAERQGMVRPTEGARFLQRPIGLLPWDKAET